MYIELGQPFRVNGGGVYTDFIICHYMEPIGLNEYKDAGYQAVNLSTFTITDIRGKTAKEVYDKCVDGREVEIID